jgi:hypothetical protein
LKLLIIKKNPCQIRALRDGMLRGKTWGKLSRIGVHLGKPVAGRNEISALEFRGKVLSQGQVLGL